MQIVGASWLMTTLTTSAALVALVQTAISFPAFVLALPAGALADVLDRRRMIIATQGWQLLRQRRLRITFTDSVTPASLLALTLALGAGSALGLLGVQAIFPELVGRPRLAAAISLNSVALTLAQALGPTVGGLLVASAGAEAVFFFNALSTSRRRGGRAVATGAAGERDAGRARPRGGARRRPVLPQRPALTDRPPPC